MTEGMHDFLLNRAPATSAAAPTSLPIGLERTTLRTVGRRDCDDHSRTRGGFAAKPVGGAPTILTVLALAKVQ
jgi:hypothetical protein